MKGKSKFKEIERNMITELLYLKMNSEKNEQKIIRNKIRKMGFYISDFDHSHRGFSDIDFKMLIDNNKIEIID